jgi:hypothetical protein
VPSSAYPRQPSLAAALVGFALLAAALLVPGVAAAGNEAHVRTPVLWPSECARIVDRGVEPVAHFDYDVPVEDTQQSADELPDSRTHQFVALCRQHPASELLPPWITRDDVDRSVDAGLVEDGAVTYREILDETTVWADCALRVTADDDRRPITFAEAAAGVDWDTSAAPIGVYTLAGYTFEPALNLWRDRPGFVKVVDDPDDPDQDLPALALLADEQIVSPGDAIVLDACVDALGPASLELEWARFAPSLDWQPLDTVSVDDGALTVEIPAPAAAADSEILIRARLVDALDRAYVGHAPTRVTVLPCPTDGCGSPPPPSDDEPRGCSMILGPNNRARPAGLLLLVLALLVPKRHAVRARAHG